LGTIAKAQVVSSVFGTNFVTQEVQPGEMISLVVFSETPSLHPSSVYAELGLTEGGITPVHRKMVLADGWLDSTFALAWNGSLKVGSNDWIYGYIASAAQATFRIVAVIYTGH